jgi:hypothetical protein
MSFGRPFESVAYFISPHGFGHAARAAAVMEATHALDSSVRFEIFTTVPRWFFEQSLAGQDFGYHSHLTDIGLVQKTPLLADIKASFERLRDFLPFDQRMVEALAEKLRGLRCSLVVCDIAPLGIEVAKRAGLASVLVENFTWDWIYEGYSEEEPRLLEFISYLGERFAAADYHIQTQPICRPAPGAVIAPPVSRKRRAARAAVRRQLGLPENERAVLITMGGTPARHSFLDQLKHAAGARFVIAGAGDAEQQAGNVTLLPPDSARFYHPDLVHACDAVVGKAGYSTLAEVHQAGIPFGFVERIGFRESAVLESFVRREMSGIAITEEEFEGGLWLERLPSLLNLPRVDRSEAENGSSKVARKLLDFMRRRAAT